MPPTQQKLANAYPRKSFFIQMFTRDIGLEDCILDLVDNSIDGLIRSGKLDVTDISRLIFKRRDRKRRARVLPTVSIGYAENSVSVRDNCGGIDLDYALEEAFNFGHAAEHRPENLGIYGVGLKRALFKIGRNFTIESRTARNGFSCSVDVDDWLARDSNMHDDWRIPLTPMQASFPPAARGTKITITNLHEEVRQRMADPTFGSQLGSAIAKTYMFFLDRHIRIELNGHGVSPFVVPIARPKQGSATFERFREDGVSVRIYITVAHPSSAGRYARDAAGWYVVCNGRSVLAADKSEATGWGVSPLPPFHTQYYPFLGFVFFESSDPSKLPWTTTKQNLNKESSIFLRAKGRMAAAAQPVLAYCRARYKPDSDGPSVEREDSRDVASVTLAELSARQSVFSAPKQVAPAKTTVRVQYDAEKSDLEKIKRHIGKPRLGAGNIGKYAFDYFMKQEGLS